MSQLIELRGVWKRFLVGDQEVDVLRDIHLAIRHGEFVAIRGASGSGKTTCLEILGAISPPSAGEYFFEGVAVHQLDDDALADLRAAKMGFVFQTFNLMRRMSAVRNVALPLLYAGVGRAEREQRARAALAAVGLAHRLDYHPGQMSGGERQRVAIARALVNHPAVIFADEPTGNLDLAAGSAVLEMFEELHRKGHTLVIVTHDEGVARRAGRVIEISDGRVIRDG